MTVTIRDAAPADVQAIVDLLEQLGHPISPETTRHQLALLSGTGSDRVLVAESDGVVLGVLSLHWTPLLHRDRPLGRVTALVVDDAARGQGVGSRLVAEAERVLRAAPVGVIFRRGPSKWVQIVQWNTVTDTFTPGQWFHGRVYERRSDLSPNGALLIYAARKEKARRDEEYTELWTAISRPPYLTALALWPCRSSVGGGLFLSSTKVWLNHWAGGAKPHPNHRPQGLQVDAGGPDVLEEAVLDRRLEREGWRHVQEWQGEKNGWRGYMTHAPSIREKRRPHEGLALQMATTITGFKDKYAYRILGGDGMDLPLDGAEWADWDQSGRLVFAWEGRLFALAAEDIGRGEPRELVDLNGHKPEPMEAPTWAKSWSEEMVKDHDYGKGS